MFKTYLTTFRKYDNIKNVGNAKMFKRQENYKMCNVLQSSFK